MSETKGSVTKKRISVKEAEQKFHEFVQEADMDEFCKVLGDVFGVYAEYDVDHDDLIIEPTDAYCGVFGEFQYEVEPNRGKCACGSLFDPEKDKYVSETLCKCGTLSNHWHCHKCGGISDSAF